MPSGCGPRRPDIIRAWPAAPEPGPRVAPIAAAPDSAVWRTPPPEAESAIAPVVQVKNRIRTGSASRDMKTIANPVKTVCRFFPVPIRVNAVAYTAAAAGL